MKAEHTDGVVLVKVGHSVSHLVCVEVWLHVSDLYVGLKTQRQSRD